MFDISSGVCEHAWATVAVLVGVYSSVYYYTEVFLPSVSVHM